MVARITPSTRVRNVLHYNENKVTQQVAQLIHASGFAKDTEALTLADKSGTFEKRLSLNERTKVNAVHVSLNFHPSEKLTVDTLRQIADDYMRQIGFGKQPYLVYQHHDAAHPHLHIVSTNIQANGKAINLNNIGRNQSETARKAIEIAYGLVVAGGNKELQEAYQLKPIDVQKVIYGPHSKSGTKRAITNVLDNVLKTYKYSSLAELNAVLKNYNVVADRGSAQSRIYKNNGLVYRVLDNTGKMVGVPIPASHFYNQPTLAYLNDQFSLHEPAKQQHKRRVRNAIDLAFATKPITTIHELSAALINERVQLVLRQNTAGIIYGLTYIDHEKKAVFNGSDLGKPYSANQIQQRLIPSDGIPIPKQTATLLPTVQQGTTHQPAAVQRTPASVDVQRDATNPLLNIPSPSTEKLSAPGIETGSDPTDHMKKKRKRKHHH